MTESEPQSDEPLPNHNTFDLIQFEGLPTSVTLRDGTGPLLELSVYTPMGGESKSKSVLDPSQRAAVSALLEHVPSIVQSGYLAYNTTYKLSFAPDVVGRMAAVMKAQDGGLRAIAVDGQRKIIGNGILHPSYGVRMVGVATAAWQIAAIITAQVHLSEIQTRLSTIERGVNEIRAFLEAEQISKIETGMRFITETAAVLGRKELSTAERERIANQLEHIWRDCGQVGLTMLALQSHAHGDFESLSLRVWRQLDGRVDAVNRELATYERRARAFLLAQHVRVSTIMLHTMLQSPTSISQHRLEELRRDVTTWSHNLNAFFTLVNQDVTKKMKAPLRTKQTVKDKRKKVISNASETKGRLIALRADVYRMNHYVSERVRKQDDTAEPTTLIVTLDTRGQIAETYHLPGTIWTPEPRSTRGQS